MAFEKTKGESKEAVDPGNRRYGRLARMFREGYLSLCIYKNVHEHRVFYDIVIYRKVKNGKSVEKRIKEIDDKIRDLEMEKERLSTSLKPTDNSAYEWRRGTNLKPSDLKDLEVLDLAAQEFLRVVDKPK